jgi:hypothetical protein
MKRECSRRAAMKMTAGGAAVAAIAGPVGLVRAAESDALTLGWPVDVPDTEARPPMPCWT